MAFHDLFGQGQTQAGAAVPGPSSRNVGPVERDEDFVDVVRADSGTVIHHTNREGPCSGLDKNLNLGSHFGVLTRICAEVEDGLVNL